MAEPKSLRQIAINARQKGELAVAHAADLRRYEILPAEKPETFEHDAWRSIHVLAINRSLNDTNANLKGRILRITTIDPSIIYGGQIVFDRFKLDKPKVVVIHGGFKNDEHEFRYTVKAVR